MVRPCFLLCRIGLCLLCIFSDRRRMLLVLNRLSGGGWVGWPFIRTRTVRVLGCVLSRLFLILAILTGLVLLLFLGLACLGVGLWIFLGWFLVSCMLLLIDLSNRFVWCWMRMCERGLLSMMVIWLRGLVWIRRTGVLSGRVLTCGGVTRLR